MLMFVLKVDYLETDGEIPSNKSYYYLIEDRPDEIAGMVATSVGNLNVTMATLYPIDLDNQVIAEAMFKLAQNQGGMFEGQVF